MAWKRTSEICSQEDRKLGRASKGREFLGFEPLEVATRLRSHRAAACVSNNQKSPSDLAIFL
jgi:hypothetical protein